MVLKLHSSTLLPAFQSFNHLPVEMRVFQVHVERVRIGGTDPGQTSFTAPEFHSIESKSKIHMFCLFPKALDGTSFYPDYIIKREDQDETGTDSKSD